MKLKHLCILLMTAMLACMLPSCSSKADSPAQDETVMLRLRIKLQRPEGAPSRATGDEYEGDKQPVSDDERMSTVRIIIVDQDGYVEHNTVWDLTARPDIIATGEDFPVKANETKTIVIVANEDGANVTVTRGAVRETLPAAGFLGSLSASAGSKVDMDQLKGATLETAYNAGAAEGQLRLPLVSSAIHSYYIGSAPNTTATFTVSRAAVKYEFRFTNADTKNTYTVKSVSINNVAEREYLFHDADFTDETQYFWNSYTTPDTGGKEMSWDSGVTVAPGGQGTVGPIYLPEGHVSTNAAPYCVAFTLVNENGTERRSEWLPLNWSIPQQPDVTSLMTDLPRNTFVIVNVNILTPADIWVNYTVCPWQEFDIDIPDFN